jgi:single-stranded-DNA-specific exonuclease
VKIVQRTTTEIKCDISEQIHPVLRRIYASRGIGSDVELDLALARLLPVSSLKGVEQAAQLLLETLEQKKAILIVGDYDADGATSTALAMLALKSFGAADLSYLVPNRFDYGYGLSAELVDLAAQNKPGLIITVDNGISSISGVERANALGIDVLVTDHHLPAEQLPEAAAIVNPNQPGDSFGSKNLAGVGVIFYVMAALNNLLREKGWFEQQGLTPPKITDWLDLVALGTVTDLVPLDRNNRILVSQGLKRIRAGRCRPGIRALLTVAKRNLSNAVASDMGFAVGPRLNAAGRLEDMGVGIECLLTESDAVAQELASTLNELNLARRNIEQEMHEQAEQALNRLHRISEGELPSGLCLYDEAWHQGVVGILASRIKEQYHRPVIAFADGGEGLLKGSARSIKGLHMRDLLDRIAKRLPEAVKRFGGHAMAAGMTLQAESFQQFKAAYQEEVEACVDGDMLQGLILTDGELNEDEFNLDLAQTLREAGPWGQAFPEPLFEGEFRLQQQRVVGESHLKLRLATLQEGRSIEAIAFNQAELPANTQQVKLAYRLDINEFRGLRELQLIVETIQSQT